MEWVKQSVNAQFAGLVLNLVALHQKYGKEKNKTEFQEIKQACEQALEVLFVKEMPKEVDTKMRTVINAINTALNGIKKKKGNQGWDIFEADMKMVERAKEIFDIAFNENVKEEERKKKETKKTTLELQSMESEHKENEPTLEEDDGPHLSDLIIASHDFLQQQINLLDQLPERDYSWNAFFKSTWNRSWKRHPVLSGVSAATLYTAASYELLDLLNQFVSPYVDELLHADTTGWGMKEMLKVGGAAIGFAVAAGVIYISRPKTASALSEQEAKSDSVVRIDIIGTDENEKAPLLQKEMTNRHRISPMCC